MLPKWLAILPVLELLSKAYLGTIEKVTAGLKESDTLEIVTMREPWHSNLSCGQRERTRLVGMDV